MEQQTFEKCVMMETLYDEMDVIVSVGLKSHLHVEILLFKIFEDM